MKKYLLATLFFLFYFQIQAQNVGIGTTNPVALLHVADSSVLFTGPLTVPATTTYNPPASGAGTRMFWYPQQAAFRAGTVTNTQWDKDSIGSYSFATGLNSKASGYGAISMGNVTTASGVFAVSTGIGTIASGFNSFSTGEQTDASGEVSFSTGSLTHASGLNSFTAGFGTNASGIHSFSTGSVTRASGSNATSMGSNTLAKSVNSLVIGQNNDTSNTNSVFEIGNGSSPSIRKNALTVLMNGNTGIGTSAPNAPLQFANTTANRKIVLYEVFNNDHEYYGFGVNGNTLRYQTYSPDADHVFYSALGASSSTELFRIKGDGNIGIGTSTPNAQLQLANTVASRKIVLYEVENNDHRFSGFGIKSDALLYQVAGINADHAFFAGTSSTASAELFRIKGNGNIGIGNSNPLASLAFNNSIGNKIALYTNNATSQYGIGIQSGQLQLYTDVPTATINFGSGSSTSFSERMRIVNSGGDGMVLSGKVLIKSGTGLISDVPGVWTYKPDNSALLGFIGTQNSTNIGFFSGITNQWGLVFDAANMRVGIGTSAPTQALQVNGNIFATGTITPSDARYKKNILMIDHPLEKLQILNGVTYNYRQDEFPDMKFPDATQVGLIAQEVEKVFPQLVFTDDKGYKAVDYVKLLPLLIEALKEEKVEREKLQKRIEALEK
ncbi:MAG: tail fiber domain-containing protein [Chitinophagaceae bacterium]|nr:tail fiber domain-containing protein [Chitinophagaceae bacterium]